MITGDKTISRYHAKIIVGSFQCRNNSPGSVIIKDGNDKGPSPCGSFLNGVKLEGGQEREVSHGDTLSFGAQKTMVIASYSPVSICYSGFRQSGVAVLASLCDKIGECIY